MRRSLLALAILVSAMPGSLQASRIVNPPATHRVRRGETAARIARDNGLSLAQLEAINPKVDLSHLAAGAVLKVRAPRAVPKDLPPMPPLPATPAPGPTSLTHLERILPTQVRDLSAQAQPDGEPKPALAGIGLQPVLPAPVPGPDPVQDFEAADRDHLDLLWPVETRTVSSAWGPRMRVKTVRSQARKRRIRYRGSHKGVDLTAPKGTDVYAALDGKVMVAGRQKGYGNYVMLDHGNGVVTLYGHHNRNYVREGEIVHRGQKIAEVGRTGNATGPHLHFELRLDGAPTNPLPYLNDVEEIPAEQIAQNQALAPPRTRH